MPKDEIVKEIDILDIIAILLKNFKLIVSISLLFMIGVVTYSVVSKLIPNEKSYLPDVYSPESLVILNSSNSGSSSMLGSSGMGALAGLAGISGSVTGPTEADLAIKLATTNSFINKLNDSFNLSDVYNTNSLKHPKTELKKIVEMKLTLKVDEDSGLLVITYTDINKELATKIVNKATEILEEEFSKIDNIRNNEQLEVIRNNKTKIEAEIQEISNETINFQKKNNLIDVDIVFSELTKQMSKLQSSLLSKDIEIENYSLISNIQDPGYKRLVNEKSAIQNAIKKLENGDAGNFPPVKNLPELGLELQELKARMSIKQALYKNIVQQYEALKLTTSSSSPTFQVLEMAEVPEQKSGPSRGKLCIIVSFTGFFLSLFIVFFKEVWISIKNDPAKMKRLKG